MLKYKNIYITGFALNIPINMNDTKVIDVIRQRFNLDYNLLPQIKKIKCNFEFYKKIIKSKCSIAIHIRRGDYIGILKRDNKQFPNENYFLNAMENVKLYLNKSYKDIDFFFFSNDMPWVRNKIIPKLDSDINYTLVDCNDEKYGFLDFYLISKAHHQISSVGRFCNTAYRVFNTYENKILITPNKNDLIIGDEKL